MALTLAFVALTVARVAVTFASAALMEALSAFSVASAARGLVRLGLVIVGLRRHLLPEQVVLPDECLVQI